MVSIPTAAPSAYFPSADSYNNNMETSNNDHDLDNCAEPPSSLPYFANPSRHEFATASSSTSPTSNRVVDSSRSLHGPGHGQVQLNPRSCVTCRRRKVRCDKTIPCANCIKVGVECVFPAPGRAPRKSKRPSETQLLDRLKRLEGVIDQLRGENGRHPSVNVDAVAGIPATKKSPTIVPALLQPQPSALKDATSSRESQTEKAGCLQGVMGRDFRNLELRNLGAEVGRLVIDQGRSRYVSHKLWESLGDEIEELQDLLDPSSDEEADYPSPDSTPTSLNNSNAFFFGHYSLAHSLRVYHPSPDQVQTLWNTYEGNVFPLIPINYPPTTKKLVREAWINTDSLDKISEAFVLTIYFAAIVSMSPETCLLQLGEDRNAAVARYRFAVEQALAKADFLNTQSLMLLQAIVLFLYCVHPQDDTKFVWSMSAVVVRLAQGLGLHRDGTNFGLSPFETEIRRRLWWHICLLEFRSADEHGAESVIHERMFDVRLPLNINIDDMNPEMQEAPPERVGYTEMTFALSRFEIITFLRRVSNCGKFCITERSEKLVQAIRNHLEERYIKYCDPKIPMHWVCVTVIRIILARFWLLIHHPLTRSNRETPLSHVSRDSLLVTSVESIEAFVLLCSQEVTAKWAWMCQIGTQSPAIVFILSELCVRPISPLTERAWRAVSTLFKDWEKNAKRMKGMMWRPIRRLMDRAATFRAKQQEELRTKAGGGSIPPAQGNLLEAASICVFPEISIPTTPAIGNPEDMMQTEQATTLGNSPDFYDIHYNATSDLFPSRYRFANSNPVTATVNRASAPPHPSSATTAADTFKSETDAMDTSQGSPLGFDPGWEAWNRVMREFQIDAESDLTSYYELNNLSEWLL
ncbi:hypothetical protein MAP00_004619 [Monascus purpureus]|nr:hypothetical protein MAP00_004619 [Monascus purpureus]